MAEQQNRQSATVTEEQKLASIVAEAVVKVQERIAPIESRHPSLTSPFNPEGLKDRPKLNARYVFCGAEMDVKFLTNEEIHALNRVSKPGTYKGGRWTVHVRDGIDGKSTVFINLPHKTIDERMDLPNSLLAILAEIEKEDRKSAK